MWSLCINWLEAHAFSPQEIKALGLYHFHGYMMHSLNQNPYLTNKQNKFLVKNYIQMHRN